MVTIVSFGQSDKEYFESGNSKIEKDNFDGAIEDFNKSIELNPNNIDAYFNRARANFFLENDQEAVNDLTKFILLSPNSKKKYSAFILRGEIKSKIFDDYKGALFDFNKAIEMKFNTGGAYISRGALKYGLGDFQGAIKDHTKAIQLNPNNYRAYRARGLSKLEIDDLTGACKDFTKASSIGDSQSDSLIKQLCN